MGALHKRLVDVIVFRLISTKDLAALHARMLLPSGVSLKHEHQLSSGSLFGGSRCPLGVDGGPRPEADIDAAGSEQLRNHGRDYDCAACPTGRPLPLPSVLVSARGGKLSSSLLMSLNNQSP